MKLTLTGKKQSTIYLSFFLTFLFLSGSTILTTLGAVDNYDEETKYLRAALVSETCVNIIAGLTYFYFLKYLYEDNIKLEDITPVRYLDWLVTTPFLIYSFSLYSTYENNKKNNTPNKSLDYLPLSYLLVLNTIMLVFGFLGETGRMNKHLAFGIAMAAFGALFYLIYDKYIDNDGDPNESVLITYGIFTAIWLLYGFSYYLNTINKNVAYNILDMISKSAFGIYLWISVLEDSSTRYVQHTTTSGP